MDCGECMWCELKSPIQNLQNKHQYSVKHFKWRKIDKEMIC